MPSNQTFAEKVLDKINLLNTTGKNYRRVNHKLVDIIQYYILEFANNIIDWYFKCLAFKYNLIKIQPQIPDYIISEINDIAKSM